MALSEAQKAYNAAERKLKRAKDREITARKERQEAQAELSRAKVILANERRDQRVENGRLKSHPLQLVKAGPHSGAEDDQG